MRKVIIQSAITGAQLPSFSPYLPITPDEIVEAIVESWQTGAAISHYHVRDPETGQPAQDLSIYREIATRVKKRCDIVLCPTTAGGPFLGIEERLAVIPNLQPEIASFDLAPFLGITYPMVKTHKGKAEYPWERDFLARQYSFCDPFTYERMDNYGRTMAKYGTKPEIEIFSPQDIDYARWMLKEGIVKKPLQLQFCMVPGYTNIDYLLFLYRSARENLGDFNFFVLGTGKAQMKMITLGVALGGNVRVGLEDALKNARGELCKNSAEQVANAVKIVEGMGFEVATPAEARQMLGLKGLDKVNF